jgi:hypothetical protein
MTSASKLNDSVYSFVIFLRRLPGLPHNHRDQKQSLILSVVL